MEKIKVIIIDDEGDARFVLRTKLESEFSEIVDVVEEADSVNSGLTAIKEYHPDLVFLDIKMRDGTGFDLLEQLGSSESEIIFVTAFDKFAVKAFQFSAIGYLMKPIKTVELHKIIEEFQRKRELLKKADKRIKVLIENHGDEKKIMKLVISNMEGFKVMEIENIIRLEADGNYTKFITTDKRRETASKNLGVYNVLLTEYGFFRVHQSTLINLRHVTGFLKGSDMIEMSDGEMVKLSRYRKAEFSQKFI